MLLCKLKKKILRSLLILTFTQNKFSCWNIKQAFPESSANGNKDIRACPTICQGMCLYIGLKSVEPGSDGYMYTNPAVEEFRDAALNLLTSDPNSTFGFLELHIGL